MHGMKTVTISEARGRLPAVIDEVMASQEGVVITRHGRPVASVQPYRPAECASDPYPLRGTRVRVAPDFDAPMPELWGALAMAEAVASPVQVSTAKRRKTGRRA
jgi:prevent-host-death family protein